MNDRIDWNKVMPVLLGSMMVIMGIDELFGMTLSKVWPLISIALGTLTCWSFLKLFKKKKTTYWAEAIVVITCLGLGYIVSHGSLAYFFILVGLVAVLVGVDRIGVQSPKRAR